MQDERQIKENKGSKTTSLIEQSLKVGIHEWIIVDHTMDNPITLWTDGLIGCVGIAIITPTCAFVTHISSKIGTEDWENTVKNEFLVAIGKIEDIDKATECSVVGGENLTLFNAVLPSVDDIMNDKTDDKCRISYAEYKPGVAVYLGGGKPRIQVIKMAEEGPSIQYALNSVTGAKHYKARGFFTCAEGSPADLGKG